LIVKRSDPKRDVKALEAKMRAILPSLEAGSVTWLKITSILAADILASGDGKAAAVLYEQMLKFRDNDVVMHNNLANIYLDAFEYLDKALVHAEAAYRLSPKNYSVVDTYGWVLFKLGRVKEAQARLHESILLKEVTFNTLHYAETLLEDPSSAKRWLARAKSHARKSKSGQYLAEIKRLEELLKK